MASELALSHFATSVRNDCRRISAVRWNSARTGKSERGATDASSRVPLQRGRCHSSHCLPAMRYSFGTRRNQTMRRVAPVSSMLVRISNFWVGPVSSTRQGRGDRRCLASRFGEAQTTGCFARQRIGVPGILSASARGEGRNEAGISCVRCGLAYHRTRTNDSHGQYVMISTVSRRIARNGSAAR